MNRLKNKWKQKRPCPKCRSQKINLIYRPHGLGRYFLKCENCHWCSGNAPTIGWAIRKWDREAAKQYKEMLKRAYG